MARKPAAGAEGLETTTTTPRQPDLLRCRLSNDAYTTMEVVVRVLETVFNKAAPDAYGIMLQVHHDGHGVCGSYPFEIAETKVETVHDMARQEGFPLRASIEEA